MLRCLPAWTYDANDPGLKLFTLARPLLPAIPAGGSVLEIGYLDTNWAERCKQSDPSLTVTAIDWRDGKTQQDVTLVQADVLTWEPGQTFDAIVSLSAIEHIGLGHYAHDPKAEDGDVRTVCRIRRWLKPGGWAYFDVPFTPEGFRLIGTKCRCYDACALRERFGDVEILGYTNQSISGWLPEPARSEAGGRPYGYVALVLRT